MPTSFDIDGHFDAALGSYRWNFDYQGGVPLSFWDDVQLQWDFLDGPADPVVNLYFSDGSSSVNLAGTGIGDETTVAAGSSTLNVDYNYATSDGVATGLFLIVTDGGDPFVVDEGTFNYIRLHGEIPDVEGGSTTTYETGQYTFHDPFGVTETSSYAPDMPSLHTPSAMQFSDGVGGHWTAVWALASYESNGDVGPNIRTYTVAIHHADAPVATGKIDNVRRRFFG